MQICIKSSNYFIKKFKTFIRIECTIISDVININTFEIFNDSIQIIIKKKKRVINLPINQSKILLLYNFIIICI